jgi:hypothetical protein
MCAPSAVLAYPVSGPSRLVSARGSCGDEGPGYQSGRRGRSMTEHGFQKLTLIPRAAGRDGVLEELASV